MKSKNTTITGIITIAAGAVFIAASVFGVDLPVIGDGGAAVAAIIAGFGLLKAKDEE
jgi:hypothetical protein